MKKKTTKILGRFYQAKNPSLQDANRWLHTIGELRRRKGICRKRVYRLKPFKEADEWMNRMLIEGSLEIQR